VITTHQVVGFHQNDHPTATIQRERDTVVCSYQLCSLPWLHYCHISLFETVQRFTNRNQGMVADWLSSSALVSINEVTRCNSSWLCGPAVEHRSLAGVLSLSCARFVADG